MPTSMNENSLLCAISAIAAAVFGYYLRARVSDKASSRKEDWEKINKIVNQINDLTDAAQEFYCHPPTSPEERKKLGLKIQATLRKIWQEVIGLQFERPATLDGYHRRLRQATTMEFGGSNQDPLELDSPAIQTITTACGSYVGAIQLSYARKYRREERA